MHIEKYKHMRLDYPPSYTERIGAVSIHALQKIYEIDSGKMPRFNGLSSAPVHKGIWL